MRDTDALATRVEIIAPRPSVLLVDDQPARLLSYEAVLSGLEVRCVRALSGFEALERLLKEEFALIVLDVNMPDMDGFEVARMVRQHPRLEHTPIIFVTGVNVTELDRLRGYEVGGIDYISIPVVPEILRSKVAILVELHQRRTELQRLNDELNEARAQLAVQFTQAMAASEVQLRTVNERLLLAKSAARLGIHDWDIRTGALEWDERIRELWGMDPDEVVTYEKFIETLHPEDRDSTQRAVDLALDATHGGRYFAEYRVIHRKDRTVRWIEAIGIVTFEAGEPVRLVGTVQDVTERKNLVASLKQADARKDEFLAMLAHELRNPLAPIRNSAEVLARFVPLDHTQQSMVDIIRRQARQLSLLLDDLLDVARITQGRIELRPILTTLGACLETAVETVAPSLNDKKQTFTVTGSPDLVIRADPARITQCLVNVLNNAVKFTPPEGSIVVTLSTVQPSVTHPARAMIQVTDSGIGISPDLLPQLFEMFVQGERVLNRAYGGLGVGLALCRRMREMHGGQIFATSGGVDHGSTFTLCLPLAG